MHRSGPQLRTIAIAMLIMGVHAEIAGVALLVMDRPAIAVMIAGLFLVILGVVFLSLSRR